MSIAPMSPTTTQKLQIFLTDDHTFVREGIKTLVNGQGDMRVTGDADTGEEALRKLREKASHNQLPDVVVMDVSLPGKNGAEVTALIKKHWGGVKVIALSMHEDKSYLRSLLEAGASGYVLKRSASDELIQAIRTVASGQTYLDPALTASVVESFVRSNSPSGPLRGEISGTALSERENAVLRLIAQGFTNKEIGVQLKISVKTVETYKARSMEKLALDSRADIVRYALAQGWLK